MPTTALTPIAAPGAYPTAWTTITFTAGDNVNNNHFVATGKDIILVRNTGGGSGTLTITGPADPYGRTASVQATVSASAFAVFGPIPPSYWANSSGQVVLTPSAATMEICILRLP